MNRPRGFLLLLIALTSLVSVAIITPFLQYVLAAIIIAYVLYPVNVRLVPLVGDRVAPLVLIPAMLVLTAIPLAYLGTVFVQDLREFIDGEPSPEILELEARVADFTGEELSLEGYFALAGEEVLNFLLNNVPELFALSLEIALGVTLSLFLVYYLLKDGEQFVSWLTTRSPLPRSATTELFNQIHRTTWGVVIGHISVAVVQGIVGGIGLYLAGIPNTVFWTAVMIVLALLPLIGAFLIWGAAAAYLFLIGDIAAGFFLTAYGLFVVSMIDNYARPIVIDQQANLNPGVILIGVFGGVYTFGFTGLFIGPIVLGVLAATIATYHEKYEEL